jgi:nucleotide-binding universal stress UspA family protein
MKRILLAYDGGEPAKKALEQAAMFATTFGASVNVVSVVPVHPGRAPIDPWDDREVHAQELKEAGELLKARGVPYELTEAVGDVPKMIESIAEKGEYDLIVVGSRGLGTVERMLQGSVSEHLATHAPATLVIAR